MLQALCGEEREESRNVGQVSECCENPPAPQRDSISCFLSPKNVTWVWVLLREIYIAQVQALSLWFVLPADAAETTRAMKAESDFGASHLQ